MIPILALVGIAVDTQMTLTRKNKVQAVIDSVMILGARQMQDGVSCDDVARGVDAYVTALLNQQKGRLDCAPVVITYRDETQDIDASIICSQPTTLSNVIGRTHMDFQVRSGSTYGIGKVDVAFVFDVSGSMGNSGKMDDLKAAALDAIDTLLPASYDTARLDDVRLAMTTCDTMVNAGTYFNAVANKNATRTYTVNYDKTTRVCVSYRPNGNCRRYEDVVTPLVATKTITNRCVKERVGAEAFTDAAPAPGAWIEAAEARFNTSTENGSVETCNSIGPLPLTDSRSDLKAYVNNLIMHPMQGAAPPGPFR